MSDQQKKLWHILMQDYATKQRLNLPDSMQAMLHDMREMAKAHSVPFDTQGNHKEKPDA